MRREKKVSAGVPFVKKGDEIVDGDTVTIANEGQLLTGQYGEQFIIKIKLGNGEERAMALNQTTENNLIEGFGEDSINWVGKKVEVFLEKTIKAGKRSIFAYLAPEGWTRDEFGEFMKNGDQGASKETGVRDGYEDIPIIYENE